MIKRIISKISISKEKDAVHPSGSLDGLPLEVVFNKAWGWRGVEAAKILQISSFGHLIFADIAGEYWFNDQDEMSLENIGKEQSDIEKFLVEPDIKEIWNGGELTKIAISNFGSVDSESCYGFKIPPVLGGDFVEDNLAMLPLRERIFLAGDLARQIDGLPDGQKIQIEIVD